MGAVSIPKNSIDVVLIQSGTSNLYTGPVSGITYTLSADYVAIDINVDDASKMVDSGIVRFATSQDRQDRQGYLSRRR